jgi:Arc/MetJ-type ribon-helix-helix transcriptional regulator
MLVLSFTRMSKSLQSTVREELMTIDLKPEQQRVIDLAVRSGAYQNPGEVLDQAFEIIREQLDLEDWMLGQREKVAAHIAEGFAQAERGELTDGDAVVEMLRRRRAERLKPRE